MTPLQHHSQSVISAIQEGKIETIIYFYENNLLNEDWYLPHHKNIVIKTLAARLGISEEQINYWVDEHFKIK